MGDYVPTPAAIQIWVCDQCGIEWSKHVSLTVGYDEDHETETNRPVGLQDCVMLLKRQNQGPPGPPGPMGPMGNSPPPPRWVEPREEAR